MHENVELHPPGYRRLVASASSSTPSSPCETSERGRRSTGAISPGATSPSARPPSWRARPAAPRQSAGGQAPACPARRTPPAPRASSSAAAETSAPRGQRRRQLLFTRFEMQNTAKTVALFIWFAFVFTDDKYREMIINSAIHLVSCIQGLFSQMMLT